MTMLIYFFPHWNRGNNDEGGGGGLRLTAVSGTAMAAAGWRDARGRIVGEIGQINIVLHAAFTLVDPESVKKYC